MHFFATLCALILLLHLLNTNAFSIFISTDKAIAGAISWKLRFTRRESGLNCFKFIDLSKDFFTKMMRKNLKGPPTFYETRKTHFWHIFAKMCHFIKVLLPSRQSYKLFVGKEFRLFLVVASISKKKDSLLTCSRKKEKSSREQSSFFFLFAKIGSKVNAQPCLLLSFYFRWSY